mmetsp:Transcript_35276/g.112787  ORF Transcript_35276/g.112787 Transcript_35276/m.112787 type:complete len:601 (+) Transcript_35276:59-1861(+)
MWACSSPLRSQQQQLRLAAGVTVILGATLLDRPWLRRLKSLWTPWALGLCAMAEPETMKFIRAAHFVLLVPMVLRFRPSKQWFLDVACRFVPGVQQLVDRELRKVTDDLRQSLKKPAREDALTRLPKKGRDRHLLAQELRQKAKKENDTWEDGFVSGAVYGGEREHLDLTCAAFAAYSVANPLHPDIWPSVTDMEAEVVAMTASFLNGGDLGVCGALTTGGTESIILAAKAHRDKFRNDVGSGGGTVVACVTAHAAIEKACDLLGMTLAKVKARSDFRIDVKSAERALTADTVLLYASAPAFPQGAIDDIPAMADLAKRHGVGLHVDACLGGFVLPFIRRKDDDDQDTDSPSDRRRALFDFAVDGVTSMSVDTHKYGYAPKGTSVVLYRSAEYRKYQYFSYPDWTGGLYVTPTIPGSRSGAVIAATWASLVSLGEEGLRSRAEKIHAVANDIAKSIKNQFPSELRLLGANDDGTVDSTVVCFGAAADDDENLAYALNDELVEEGWSLNALQNPPSLHLCCTLRTAEPGVKDRFLNDLRRALDSALEKKRSKDDPNAKEKGGSAAIYGATASVPAGPVSAILRAYTDIQLTVVGDSGGASD